MEFAVEFYMTAAGKSPVEGFLEDLRKTDSGDHAAVMVGLVKLRHRKKPSAAFEQAVGGWAV